MNAVAEALSSAAIPSAEAAAHAKHPATTPTAVATAARMPPATALRVTSAMSAPGVTVSTAATAEKASSWETIGRRQALVSSRRWRSSWAASSISL